MSNSVLLESHRRNFRECRDLMVSAAKSGYKNRAEAYMKSAIQSANYLIEHASNAEECQRYEFAKASLQSSMSEASKKSDSKQQKSVSEFAVTFDDIIGQDEAKEQILMALCPIQHPELAAKYSKHTPNSFVILYGPPGTGKTTLAKAISNEINADMITVKASDLLSSYVGESEKNVASLFAKASKNQRHTILYFDDTDALFAGGHKELYQTSVVNEFKTQIEGFNARENVTILLSCNNPNIIDIAILSRATAKVYVGLPNKEDRSKIFEKSLSGLAIAENIDFEALGDITEDFNGRDIRAVCDNVLNSQWLAAARKKEQGADVSDCIVTMDDLIKSVEEHKNATKSIFAIL